MTDETAGGEIIVAPPSEPEVIPPDAPQPAPDPVQLHFVTVGAAGEVLTLHSPQPGTVLPLPTYIPLPADQLADAFRLMLVDGAFVPRPVLAGFDRLEVAAGGEDVAALSGLPIPCMVEVNGVPELVDDGSLEIGSTLPGRFRVVIQHAPYMPFDQTVAVR